jgi:hypothetical protein
VHVPDTGAGEGKLVTLVMQEGLALKADRMKKKMNGGVQRVEIETIEVRTGTLSEDCTGHVGEHDPGQDGREREVRGSGL